MKHVMVCFLLIFGLLTNIAFAGESREVELDDGSVLLGEIVSLEGDVLTLNSGTLGLVKINASRIRNIRMKPGASDAEEDQFAKLRDSMMNDPEIMEMVLSLQDNQEVQEVLRDPALMQALSSGDVKALLSNPKVIKLLNNPKIQDIGKKALKQE